MQHELESGKLLDENGWLCEAGYAKKLVKDYNRSDVKASGWRIKEWDYYIVTDGRAAAAFTVADNSYMALISASVLDFENPSCTTASQMKWLTFGKLALPPSSESGSIVFEDSRVKLNMLNDGKRRRIECEFRKFNKAGETLTAEIDIDKAPEDSMVIATPFYEKKTAFYYNQKINCMKCSGFVTVGNDTREFSKCDSLATLDWGRGVWTYSNTWYWGSLSAYVDGVPVGINIGYGFGDLSAASENMIFCGGKAHKTEGIVFNIPQKDGKDDFMSPWTFESTDGRIELSFDPVLDRFDDTNIGVISSWQHQVFGKMNGVLILDDGTKIEIRDKIGFAEKVRNRW